LINTSPTPLAGLGSTGLLGTGDSMNKEHWQEELQNAFAGFAAQYPQTALALITGLFVGLLEYTIEEGGGDKNNEIKIDGGNRDITIAAVPNV
jgi:hypothetical protein